MALPDSLVPALCRQCGQQLSPGELACPHCRTLVHGEELHRLSAQAGQFEGQQRLAEARELWTQALLLLPPHSKQADWIEQHTQGLEQTTKTGRVPKPDNKWAQRLGPVGPIAVLLVKSKALFGAVFKLKFLLSFAAFMGIYWSLYGPSFGIGFAVLILIHELGHLIDVKRRGLPADMPVFLPGLGAYVRWQALGVPLETRAAIALAGPFAGLLATIACLLIWRNTAEPVWGALARASAWLNILNLIPVWVLDGGQAASAMSKAERLVLITAGLGLWLLLGQNLFFLVAAGATYRLFTKDFPSQPGRVTTVYFLALLALLGSVLWLSPGHGSGLR
ncbi:MAG TPA: site-2 protease family protein [Terriglobales bacterium]|nr:site-2 protease family protein [Terriglobales bacterium]